MPEAFSEPLRYLAHSRFGLKGSHRSTYLFSGNQRAVSTLNHRVIFPVSGPWLHLFLSLLCAYVCVHLCVWGVCHSTHSGDQRKICSSQFSFHHTMWDLGIKIELSGLVTSTFTSCAILSAQSFKIWCHKALSPNPGTSFSIRNLTISSLALHFPRKRLVPTPFLHWFLMPWTLLMSPGTIHPPGSLPPAL